MDPNKEDIRFIEPSSNEELMPTPITWEAWAIGGGVLLIILLAAWVLWRNRRPKPVSAEDLHKKAHQEAIAALAACPSEERTPTATECSLILRRYLATVTGDAALFETHEEWVSRNDAVEDFNEALKEQIREHFGQLATWKYAPDDLGDEPATIIDQSRKLLESINQEVAA